MNIYICLRVCVGACVNCYFMPSLVRKQGAIPLIIGGWPTKRPMMRAANVPANFQLHKPPMPT